MGGTSVSQLHVRLRDDPTGPCSDDPNESDQSELSLTLLRTPIVHGGGKVSDKEGRGGHEYRGQAQQNFMEAITYVVDLAQAKEREEFFTEGEGTIVWTRLTRVMNSVFICMSVDSVVNYSDPQTKHGYLQSNEEEEFLQQVSDVLQKTKLEKKKPSPKLQAQEPPVTKPAPPSELDPPETKVVGSSKPSDISGHQEVKPKAAETKGGDAANHPPIAEQKVLKDESTATSPDVTLDDPISHAPKERFISQTSIDSTLSSGATTPQSSVPPNFPPVISEDAHPVTMLDMSLHSGLQGFQPMQPPVLPHPGVGMSPLYAPPPPQPSMHASLTSSTFQNMGAMGNVSSSIGLGTIPPSNAGLGSLLSSNGGLGTLPPNAGLGTLLLSGIGQGTLPPNAGLGILPPNAGLGTLPPNAGLGTLPPSNIGLPPTNAGLGTLLSSTSNIGLGLSPSVASLGALQMGLLPPSAAGLGTLPPNGGLGTLQPNGSLGTLPPNGGLGTMPPSAGMYAPFQQLGQTPYPGMSNSMGHQSTLPQTIPLGHPQSMPMVLPQTIPTSQGVMPSPPSHTPSVLPNLGLPLQPPPLSQLPHIVSYPNLSNMASSLSGQLEQTKKFEISEVSEGSPVTLVSFGETTVVMDSCVEGEKEMEEEDTLESSDSNMYDFTQPPLTPVTHSGAQPPPLHHHHHHHLNGAVVSDDSGHAHSMILPAKIGRSKRTRLRSHRPVSAHVASAFTAPPPLSPLVDCSPMEMPVPEPHPQAGGFLPTESQALFNEAFGQFLYNIRDHI
ncbi:hypothetical protein EMCRGX_G002972 [Ephydatia muelleri]